MLIQALRDYGLGEEGKESEGSEVKLLWIQYIVLDFKRWTVVWAAGMPVRGDYGSKFVRA